MEDMMFATVLYVGMICFVCCLRYQPNCATTVEAATTKRLTDESQPNNINQGSTTEPEQKPEPANIVVEAEAGESQPTSLSTGYDLPETVLDPSSLTLRQCRAVIREINKGLAKQERIRQKINGKDAPVKWLRGQIARYLEAYPAVAVAIEEVVKAC